MKEHSLREMENTFVAKISALCLALILNINLVMAFTSCPQIFNRNIPIPSCVSGHRDITMQALSSSVLGLTTETVTAIADANIAVDLRENNFNTPGLVVGGILFPIFPILVPTQAYKAEHHFDRGKGVTNPAAFNAGATYLQSQRQDFIDLLKGAQAQNCGDLARAIESLGHALHALQDAYAHSNYVDGVNSLPRGLDDLQKQQFDLAVLNPRLNVPADLMLTGYDRFSLLNPEEPENDPYSHARYSKDTPFKNDLAATHFADAVSVAQTASFIFVRNIMNEVGADWNKLKQYGQNCVKEKKKGVESVTSNDPNDKVGSEGVGASHYISDGEPLRYAIFFDNLLSASAPAQDVVITDQLNQANLDLTTLSLGAITFGDKVVTPQASVPLAVSGQFNADVDLRPANNLIVRVNASMNQNTNVLTWRFTSIDPDTGKPPEDPLAGFLPPGSEGSVFFTVMPKKDLSTDTVIKNKATVIFDVNPPLDTPEWFNTLDNTKPSSHVLALSASQNSTTFNVQWAGTDTGSGLSDFTVYVSDNGSLYTAWLTQTTSTKATFTGAPNHTYSFFSVARDLTGNLEATKTVAEATTHVVVNRPPIAKAKSITVAAGGACTATVSPSDVNNGSSDPDGDQIILRLNPPGPFSLGSHTVILLATDTFGNTATDPLTITVIDNTPPSITNVSVSPAQIWPPNQKMVNVTVNYAVTDNCSSVSSLTNKLSVSSNLGTPADWQVVDAHHVLLRANKGNVYTITITSMDGSGNKSIKSSIINVPHDQRN